MFFIIQLTFNPYIEQGIDEEIRLSIKNFKTNKIEIMELIPPKEEFVLDATNFDFHWSYRYLYEKKEYNSLTQEDSWVKISDYKPLYPEEKTQDGLKYLLYQNPESEHLAIVFQAMGTPPTYNYVHSLTKTNINRLYIKDDYGTEEKTKCTYYLGQNNELSIDQATQKLINEVVKKLGIEKSKTIFIGSSKGGFAALYHGYKFGGGYILPAGPQVLLGDYLAGTHKSSKMLNNIFISIFGDLNDDSKKRANNLLKNTLMNADKPYPKTNIHIGYWEPHFENHVVPFMKMAHDVKIDNVSLHVKDYKTHSGIVEFYREFLLDNIEKIKNNTYI